jgi:hypothetical protein
MGLTAQRRNHPARYLEDCRIYMTNNVAEREQRGGLRRLFITPNTSVMPTPVRITVLVSLGCPQAIPLAGSCRPYDSSNSQLESSAIAS